MVKNFYLFRHGQTDWNAENRVIGRTDVPLNEAGKKQAEALLPVFVERKIDFIVTSPLKRAQETTLIINKTLNLPLKVDDRLMEIDCGELEGRPLAEVAERYGEENLRKFVEYNVPQEQQIPGVETKQAALTRAIHSLLDVAMTERVYNIGVSSHAIIMSLLLSYSGCKNLSPIENCGLAHITYINKKGAVSKGEWKFVEYIDK